ncbi:MAG: type II toxin-antitoxin system PemK/MazF family toxin [Oscillatoriales cyanobacterium]|uniref:type II toxin-antitoxin system PemK/MazF family toxin n=1 Tax=Microcoleaceae TaxID=1892252 RepID=UPI001F28CBF6|nr:type II toxin-antitoxin system PemK/MazF family toxin [Tychonema sp. BBK16]MCF6371764.1 type II toxin-antitoxin system PemK/MazF family toxin [Tychonema sp. BBK16]TAG87265.1 MAG: type II toxin-antitoxin system PemK/MazF family toxin [Oscillatoriales cyanobacterium]TAH25557.1 MAG: type II toxin-antitoxin system PemK/MazF family toxin [Oscillatoriales cyanobacterium]
MKRGEIYYANLSPTVGSEIDKSRPVLVVSNDANNRAANTVTILPITSNITRVYPFEVLLNPEDSGLSKSSKVQVQQIRTISKQRITSDAVGSLNEEIMQFVNIALKLHLDVD